MAFARRTKAPEVIRQEVAHLPQRSLVAAAAQVPLDGASVQSLKISNKEWQAEAWRLYDISGELRFVATRRGAQLSRVRFYAAEVDEMGAAGNEAKDKQIVGLSETMFGGPAAKAEGLRLVGIQLFVAGECYVVAESVAEAASDKWYVVSVTDIKKEAGGLKVKKPDGKWHDLRNNTDLCFRVWTPHPKQYEEADSPTRSVLPVLREIERLTMLAFSQIDSRLISAGLLLLRQGIEFPHDADKPGGIQGLMDMILQAARASLQGAGSAAGLVPILAEVPGDDVNSAFAHIKFDTPLTAEITAKLDQAIRRLALGLDAPPEVLLGQGAANHWSAWQISEDEIKTQVEPVALRVADALTEAYFRPALKALNKDPDKFTLWYDTAPLAVRPNRLDDATKLYDKGVLSPEALVKAGAFDDGDVPKDDERLRWTIWELVKLNPQLVYDAEVQKILGLPALQAPAQPGMEAAPGQEVAPIEDEENALPEEPEGDAPAVEDDGEFASLLPAAEVVVLRAMEVAGGRLLDRHTRGKFSSVARQDIHTRVAARDRDHAEELLSGAFVHVPGLAAHYQVPASELEYLLRGYCTELLVRGFPHGSPLLREVLVKGGRRRGR